MATENVTYGTYVQLGMLQHTSRPVGRVTLDEAQSAAYHNIPGCYLTRIVASPRSRQNVLHFADDIFKFASFRYV